MEENALYKMRHSAAHVLAMAVLQLRPEAKLGIGPVIDNGFYYDFDLKEPFSSDELSILEQKMHELIQDSVGFDFERKVISRDEAKDLFHNQPYKLELIDAIPEGEEISVYDSAGFTDLCRGPHVSHSKEISPYFKLTSLAGAYWRGDENKPMLQRIYGVLFETKEALDAHLHQMEEAKKRDHRKLGTELDLFTFSDLVGAGLPLFTPRGTVLRDQLVAYLMSLQEPVGFERVWIPHIAKPELYKVSGHWDKFSEDLFHVRGKHDEAFVLKPMNCPHHNQIYASKPRSYRDLPIRYAEVTTNYRDEQTGELHGLSRVRSITQDDGHVYCRPDQVMDEVMKIYNIIRQIYTTFDMPLKIRLSLRDPDQRDRYLGSDESWHQAEEQLKQALEQMEEESFIGIGEAAFYGPKLDYLASDALGREWQVATIQLDFNQPERFVLRYTDSDGTDQQPIMIHRAIYGSIERFLAVLIEHYGGNFPLWLAPVQVAILPISEKFHGYAMQVQAMLRESNVRVWVDTSNESVGKKIRNAETMKYPMMLIVGQKEQDANSVAVRIHGEGDKGDMPIGQLLNDYAFTLPSAKPE